MHGKLSWTLGTLAAALLVACTSAPPVTTTPHVAAPTAATQAAAKAYDYDFNVFHPVVAQHGMVVSEQELASRVGADILKAGGNAVDAAVAVGFALAVVATIFMSRRLARPVAAPRAASRPMENP